MRICILGKYPPIEGGVCMQNYWAAHGLAQRGHEVHVVTNAKEVGPLHRMYMRAEDWQRCEQSYGSGFVRVHWSDEAGGAHFHIPEGNPFVTKLATIAVGLHAEHPLDAILSYYLEPYAVAGHLASEITGVPNIIRMAGSDAGRLWRQPQLEAVYDHVLRSAAFVVTGRAVAERATRRGIAPERIAALHGYPAPEELFVGDGPALDLAALRRDISADPDPAVRDLAWGGFAGDRPYFGVCGKLGLEKGTFSLLAALQRVTQAGLDVGLVVLGHGQVKYIETDFRAHAEAMGLADRILQLPFLPHWRVAEFMRGCLAVCCLEQDFPIVFHTPTIALETLLAGRCLVASTELVRKIPGYERLPNGYGCIALENVNDVDVLSRALIAIARDPEPTASVGARGRKFARATIRNSRYAEMLEKIVEAAAQRKPLAAPPSRSANAAPEPAEFPLTRLAAASLAAGGAPGPADTLAQARQVLAEIERGIAAGKTELAPLLPAIRLEITIAQAEQELAAQASPAIDPLYRLQTARWGIAAGDLERLCPATDAQLRVLSFDYDIAPYSRVRTLAELPPTPPPGSSHLVLFAGQKDQRRDSLLVDSLTARILSLSDGVRTASDIAELLQRDEGQPPAKSLEWIEELFLSALLGLRDANQPLPIAAAATGLRA
jgi:glycosyltransferase involved in cell wall biosynthesis